jgi:hypothetical protein
MRHPFELEWLGGGGLEQVHRLVAGLPLYVRPSLDFIAFPYTPLYYYVCALVARVLADASFLPMRLVSFGASVVVLATIAAIVRRETRRWYPAWLACGLMAATYGITDGWFDLERVDSLFLAVLLLAVYAVQRGTPLAFIAGGVCFALSFLVKQTAMLVAAPVMMWSIVEDRRCSMFLILPAAVLIAASTAYLQATSGGWYWYYVVDLQRMAGSFVPDRLFTFWAKDILRVGVAAAFGAVFLWGIVRRSSTRGVRAVAVSCGVMILGAWASRLRSGNVVNVLMPAYAAVAVLLGLAVADLEGADRWRGMFRRPALDALCLLQFAVLAFNPVRMIPTSADRQAGTDVVERIRRFDGEVFLPCEGYLATLAGKRSYAHMQEIRDIMRSPASEAAIAITADLHRSFETRRFSAVIPCQLHLNILEDAGLLPFYAKRGSLFEPGDRRFMTVAGVRLRPAFVYVPQ